MSGIKSIDGLYHALGDSGLLTDYRSDRTKVILYLQATTAITTREGSRRDSSGGLRFPHQAGRRRISAGSKEKCRPAAGLPIRANTGRSLMQCAAMRCGTDQTRPPRRYADEDYSGKVLYRNELDSNQHFQVLRKPLDKTIAAKIPNRIPFFPAGVLAT